MTSVVRVAPPGLTRLHASEDAIVFATNPGMVRQSSNSVSWELTGLHPTGADALRAGVSLDSGGACLYTDSLGFTEVYYRRVGDAVFFASRIAPLLAIGRGELTSVDCSLGTGVKPTERATHMRLSSMMCVVLHAPLR